MLGSLRHGQLPQRRPLPLVKQKRHPHPALPLVDAALTALIASLRISSQVQRDRVDARLHKRLYPSAFTTFELHDVEFPISKGVSRQRCPRRLAFHRTCTGICWCAEGCAACSLSLRAWPPHLKCVPRVSSSMQRYTRRRSGTSMNEQVSLLMRFAHTFLNFCPRMRPHLSAGQCCKDERAAKMSGQPAPASTALRHRRLCTAPQAAC